MLKSKVVVWLLFIFWAIPIYAAPVKAHLGTTMQGFGSNHILAGLQAEFSYKKIWGGQWLTLSGRLPLLFSEKGTFVFPAYKTTDYSHAYSEFHLPDSAWFYIKEISLQGTTEESPNYLGIRPLQSKSLGFGHVCWNFAGKSLTAPQYSAGLALYYRASKKLNISMDSGALSERGPWKAHAEIRPFIESPVYILQDFVLRPLVYVDTPQLHTFHYGSGLEMQTGGYRKGQFQFGTVSSVFLANLAQFTKNEHKTMGRLTTGIWMLLWTWGIEGGLIHSSQGDFSGPLLSPLYMYVRKNAPENGAKNGFYFGLLPGQYSSQGLKIRWEAFMGSEATSNIRFSWQSEGNVAMRIGYLRENMDHIADLANLGKKTGWAEFSLIWTYVPNTLQISWENQYSPAARDFYRGHLSVLWLF